MKCEGGRGSRDAADFLDGDSGGGDGGGDVDLEEEESVGGGRRSRSSDFGKCGGEDERWRCRRRCEFQREPEQLLHDVLGHDDCGGRQRRPR